VNQVSVIEAKQDRAETLRALRQICWGTARRFKSHAADERPRISTGIPALDELLPNRGLEPGSIVEWLAPVDGSGVSILALQGVRPALRRKPVWAVIDRTGEFHPPAVRGWGISLESILWLRPESVADAAWAVEQALRCPAIGMTWFQADSFPIRVFQRFKIAAETGGGIGVLFRPSKATRYASWADVRWLVHPQPAHNHRPRQIEVQLFSATPAATGGLSASHDGIKIGTPFARCESDRAVVEVCDATGDVCLVSFMADSTTAGRMARA
jgi:hypothetical protein